MGIQPAKYPPNLHFDYHPLHSLPATSCILSRPITRSLSLSHFSFASLPILHTPKPCNPSSLLLPLLFPLTPLPSSSPLAPSLFFSILPFVSQHLSLLGLLAMVRCCWQSVGAGGTQTGAQMGSKLRRAARHTCSTHTRAHIHTHTQSPTLPTRLTACLAQWHGDTGTQTQIHTDTHVYIYRYIHLFVHSHKQLCVCRFVIHFVYARRTVSIYSS